MGSTASAGVSWWVGVPARRGPSSTVSWVSGCVKQGGWEQGQEEGDKEREGKGKEDRSGGRRETGKLATAFSFILPCHTWTVQGPHLWGCGPPGSRGLLTSPLEVGAVS